jgi:broad specificity phosphatase PhoE
MIYAASNANWLTWTQLHEQGGCVSGIDEASFQGEPGMTRDAIERDFPGCRVSADIDDQGWWKSQPRETDLQLQERVIAVKGRILTEFGAGERNIACVTHADFSQKLILALLGDDADNPLADRSLLNASVTSFTIDVNQVQMDDYSNVDHLPSELVS